MRLALHLAIFHGHEATTHVFLKYLDATSEDLRVAARAGQLGPLNVILASNGFRNYQWTTFNDIAAETTSITVAARLHSEARVRRRMAVIKQN